MQKNFLTLILCITAFSAAVSAQAYKFEGHNLILQVPRNHRAPTCAIRYAPPNRQVKITDLDRSTPMNLKSCGGTASRLNLTGPSSATVVADGRTFQWCFEGEDDKYQIEFDGDLYARKVKYIWPANLESDEMGFYNIKDFGAVGDGRTDDTIAIQSALAYVAHKNGGILRFPNGDYVVGGVPP